MHSSAKLLILSLVLVFGWSSTAQAVVQILSTDNASDIGAYSARVGATVQCSGETATWVIEYGETTTYGKKSEVFTLADGDRDHIIFSLAGGMKPETLYYYRCRLTGSKTGTVTNSPKTFTTGPKIDVTVTGPPESSAGQLIEVGDDVRLNMDAYDGSYPFIFQWQRNNVNRGTATENYSLELRPFKATDAGAWKCLVKNPGSQALSPSITLVAAAVTRVPTKTIAEGTSFSASVVLTPATPNATYRWHFSGGADMSGIGTITGQSASKFTVTNTTGAAGGSYYCEVTVPGVGSKDFYAGNLDVGLKPVVDTIASQVFRVGESVEIPVDVQNDYTAVTVTGLPAGLKFSLAEGKIFGTPTAQSLKNPKSPETLLPYNISIVATNIYGKSSAMVFPIVVIPLDPQVIGTFVGTFLRHPNNFNLGGKFKLDVAKTGAVSGTVTVGTTAYPVVTSVRSSTDGADAWVDIDTLKSGKNPELNGLHFVLPGDNPGADVDGSIDGITAKGYRMPWSAKYPYSFIGTYNCVFVPQDLAAGDSADHPRGSSIGTIAITSAGAATLTAKLADGTSVTSATFVGVQGNIPFYVPLYKNKGSILGSSYFSAGTILGSLTWFKDPAGGGRNYGHGFASFGLDVVGTLWTKPKAANNDPFFGMAPGTTGAILNFRYADISGEAPSVGFNLSNTYAAVIPTAPAGQPPTNPNSVVITLNAATGAISGTFKVTQFDAVVGNKNITRTGTYFGLCVPGYPDAAIGFFTIPNMPAASPATETGITANQVQTGSVELTVPTILN